jgi:hypothetical protein
MNLLSADIETYGMVEHSFSGGALPPQTVFHPARSLHTDAVPLAHLIQTCSITLPATPIPDLTPASLATLVPGETMVFNLYDPRQVDALCNWLSWADVIVGMNFLFDILYLRARHHIFRRILTPSKIILDVGVFNYLHNENRPERSLKTIGPILGTYSYGTHTFHRYFSSTSPDHIKYNAEDSHNTLLNIPELTRRILLDYPSTPKLSEACLNHYSDRTWVCVAMAEAGIPMSRPALLALEDRLTYRLRRCERICNYTFGLPLSGPGSGKAKEAFMELLCDHIDFHCTPSPADIKDELLLRTGPDPYPDPPEAPSSIRDDPPIVRTPKKKLISFNEENRHFFANILPPKHPAHHILRLAEKHTQAQKIHSSYAYPLLYHHRRNEEKKDCVLIGPSDIQLAYPSWYIIPSPFKDDQGEAGGTLQGRVTCKGPAAQTFPPPVKKTIRSRYGSDGLICSMDLSQIELRVAALLSGDSTMMKAYLEGLDLHADRAVSVFSEQALITKYGPSYLTDPRFAEDTRGERQCAKTINFLDLFRGGAETAHDSILEMTGLDLPMSIFENMVATRKFVRPGLWAWQESLIKTANTIGYIELPIYGQSRYFLGGEVYQVNEIVNFPVQTTAGNLLLELQSFLLTHLTLLGAPRGIHMFLNIYDAIYFDLRRSSLPTLREALDLAFAYLTTIGYWYQLERHYNRHVPLDYKLTIEQETPPS